MNQITCFLSKSSILGNYYLTILNISQHNCGDFMRMVVKFIWERNRSHKLGKFFAEGQGVGRWAIRLKSVGTIIWICMVSV